MLSKEHLATLSIMEMCLGPLFRDKTPSICAEAHHSFLARLDMCPGTYFAISAEQ